jgi:transporter family protein
MSQNSWFVWALLSAVFAALTAIFAKVGVANIDSDLATFIRTVVIIIVLGGIVLCVPDPAYPSHAPAPGEQR